MFYAYILEECGIPWKVGSFTNRKDAQAALDEARKRTVPSTEQIWFYVKDGVREDD